MTADSPENPGQPNGSTQPPDDEPRETAPADDQGKPESADELEALIDAALSRSGEYEGGPSSWSLGEDANFEMDQAALDALIDAQAAEAEAVPPPVEEVSAAAQEELASPPEEPAVAQVPSRAPVAQRSSEAAPTQGTPGPTDAETAAYGHTETDASASRAAQEPAVPSEDIPMEDLLTHVDDDSSLDDQPFDALIGDTRPGSVTQTTIDQASIDALLRSIEDQVNEVAAEEPAAAPTADAKDADTGPMTQELIDAILKAEVREGAPEAAQVVSSSTEGGVPNGVAAKDAAGAPGVTVSQTAATGTAADSGGEPVTQDMIDALLAAGVEGPSPGPAAKATREQDAGLLLSQGDLDALVQQSQEEDKKRQQARQAALEVIGKPPATAGEGPAEPQPADAAADARKRRFRRKWFVRKPRPPREPGVLVLYVRNNFLKVSSSLAALVVVSLSTFTYLCTHLERSPDAGTLARLQGFDLQRAVQDAQSLMAQGDYKPAVEELDKAIAGSPPSPQRTEARFLRVEAEYRALPDGFTEKQAEPIHAEINELVETAGAHPRAPDALRIKAALYERVGIPYGARDVYEEILSNYPTAEHLDAVLVDVAEVYEKLGKPKMAARCLQRLLQQFPGSSYAGQAKLRLADAFAAAGNPDDARVLYIRTAQAQAGTPLGTEAYARLGQLDYDQGRYQEAIKQLQACLDMATTVVKGNDKVYLLLAQAYRAAGQPGEARRVLSELIDFFPETEVTPKALVELSRALDELGERKEALRVASQAAQRFPGDPAALANRARLLELNGESQAAARAWMAAHEAGANDPDVLLAAARDFRKAAALEDARNTYELLVTTFPTAAQAFEGGIELAETRYEMGQAREALDGLEDLALATEGKPQRLPVLTTLGKMYQELGLKERVAEVFSEVAALTTEPDMLAGAAVALFDADAADEALTVAKRVDPTKVKDATAYALMTAQGRALLGIDPRKALEYMERAYETYPAQRTPDSDLALLNAYLATDNFARARALVMDLAARVARNPADAPHLEKAAVAWGDQLYERGDSRAAADAYAMAIEAGSPDSPGVRWATYQRANALFRLSDFDGCVTLFDDVAASDSPWAGQATIMAEHARMEQQLRGLPVTPPRSKEG